MFLRQMAQRYLGIAAGVCALGAIAACGGGAAAAASGAAAQTATSVVASGTPASNDVQGAWHVTVSVNGSATTFDALYLFGSGGSFTRVDGRSNASSTGLGSWTRQGDEVTFSYVLFGFDATTGARKVMITVPSAGRVVDGKLTGTFTANAVDTNGQTPAGFPKTGTLEGTRITPDLTGLSR